MARGVMARQGVSINVRDQRDRYRSLNRYVARSRRLITAGL